jgi:hypothetical protein
LFEELEFEFSQELLEMSALLAKKTRQIQNTIKAYCLGDEVSRDNTWMPVFRPLEIDTRFLRVEFAEIDGISEETKVSINLLKLGLDVV